MGESSKPCVRSFCFYIDLKGACIFLAALRIIGCIFTIGYCIYLLLSVDDDETRLTVIELLNEDEEFENSTASASNIDGVIFFTKIAIYILIIGCVINVIGASLFIWGATTVSCKSYSIWLYTI